VFLTKRHFAMRAIYKKELHHTDFLSILPAGTCTRFLITTLSYASHSFSKFGEIRPWKMTNYFPPTNTFSLSNLNVRSISY